MAGAIHLAWTAEHVADLLGHLAVGDRVAPLSQPAMGAALKSHAPLAADPLALLDLALPVAEVVAQADAMSAAILDRLGPLRSDAAAKTPLLGIEALDRWHLAIWCREVVHLTAIFSRVLGDDAKLVAPKLAASPKSWLLARARLYVDAALALTGREPARAEIPQSAVDDNAVFEPPAGHVALLTSFGLRDPRASLARIRMKHVGPILIVVEAEHAHRAFFREHWLSLNNRYGPLSRLEVGRLFAWPSGATRRGVLEGAVVGQLWPRRQALAERLAAATRDLDIASVHSSDHVSDSGWALASLAEKRNVPLHLEAHGGMPLQPAFWLPEVLTARGKITLWNEAATDHYRKRLDGNGVSAWSLDARTPPALERQRLSKPHIVLRRATAIFQPLRIGILVTTGQLAFAPDIALLPALKALGRLAHGALASGCKLAFRMRQLEDDERVFRHATGLGGRQKGVSFQRAGEGSLRRFVNLNDICVEFGAPTSAALTAIAYGVPVVRLVDPDGPSAAELGSAAVPSLSFETPFEDMMRLAGTVRSRARLAEKQGLSFVAVPRKK